MNDKMSAKGGSASGGKQKKKNQFIHWLKVVVIGVALGLALQFVRAWTEPAAAPPGGNIGAPLNTGGLMQGKDAGLLINGMGYSANGLLVPYGSVGIGTFSPGFALDVNGNIKINSWDSQLFQGYGYSKRSIGGAYGWDPNMLYINGFGDWTSGVNIGGNVVTNRIAVTEICLNGDCRVSWPGGGGNLGSQEYTASGTTTWHSPPGVTKAWMTLIGGGGGGAGSSTDCGWPGESSSIVYRSLIVQPNTDYTVVVGAGGGTGCFGCGIDSPSSIGQVGNKSYVAGVAGATGPGGAGGELKILPPPSRFAEPNGSGYGTGGTGAGCGNGINGQNGQSGYVRIEW